MYICVCGYLDCTFVVSHADTGAAVPADVHGGVGAVLDVLVLRHAVHLPIYTNIVRRTCDRQKRSLHSHSFHRILTKCIDCKVNLQTFSWTPESLFERSFLVPSDT